MSAKLKFAEERWALHHQASIPKFAFPSSYNHKQKIDPLMLAFSHYSLPIDLSRHEGSGLSSGWGGSGAQKRLNDCNYDISSTELTLSDTNRKMISRASVETGGSDIILPVSSAALATFKRCSLKSVAVWEHLLPIGWL